jgi:hypothetical protein
MENRNGNRNRKKTLYSSSLSFPTSFFSLSNVQPGNPIGRTEIPTPCILLVMMAGSIWTAREKIASHTTYTAGRDIPKNFALTEYSLSLTHSLSLSLPLSPSLSLSLSMDIPLSCCTFSKPSG